MRARILLLVAAVVVSPSLFGCAYGSMPHGSELPIQEDVAVRGRVVDAESGEAIEGARVTTPEFPSWPSNRHVATTRADGSFELRTQVVLGIRGRSPLAGIPTDPLPPRRPRLDLQVETADGRSLDVERPTGRWHRGREGTSHSGLLTYEVGSIRVHPAE